MMRKGMAIGWHLLSGECLLLDYISVAMVSGVRS